MYYREMEKGLLKLLIVSSFLLFLLFPVIAGAGIVNGDFELGDLGWERSGNTTFGSSVSIDDVIFRPPGDRGSMAGINNTTANDHIWKNSILQDVEISSGDKHLSFDYNYWTKDNTPQETGFVVLLNGWKLLYSNRDFTGTFTQDEDIYYTGWKKVSVDISDFSGSQNTFAIVFRAGDSGNGVPSGVFLDNVTLSTPIPSAVLLLGSGLFGLISIRRRRG